MTRSSELSQLLVESRPTLNAKERVQTQIASRRTSVLRGAFFNFEITLVLLLMIDARLRGEPTCANYFLARPETLLY